MINETKELRHRAPAQTQWFSKLSFSSKKALNEDWSGKLYVQQDFKDFSNVEVTPKEITKKMRSSFHLLRFAVQTNDAFEVQGYWPLLFCFYTYTIQLHF